MWQMSNISEIEVQYLSVKRFKIKYLRKAFQDKTSSMKGAVGQRYNNSYKTVVQMFEV